MDAAKINIFSESAIISQIKHHRTKLLLDYLEYKGYKGSVEYSREDNCLVGEVQGMGKDLQVWTAI